MMSYPPTVLGKGLAEHRELASEAQARGRGSPREPDAVKRRLGQSQSAWPSKARGSGLWGRSGPPRSKTQLSAAARPSWAGASLQGRVRRRAPPRCALRGEGIAPEQRRFFVCACPRPHGPVCEQGYAALCLCQAFAPPWPETVVRVRALAGTAWPLQQRPIGGARSHSCAQKCPRVGPRMLSHT